MGALVVAAFLNIEYAAAGPTYTVMTGGDGLNCSAGGEGLPPNQTSATPGVTISHSDSNGSEFESWFAQANQTSLRTRTRAFNGGYNESPARSCASAAAIFTIDDLIFTTSTHSVVDVSLSLHYDGTLSAGTTGGNSGSSARFYNLASLNGQNDQSGNTSGLGLLNQSNGGIFQLNCGIAGCTDEDGAVLAASAASSATRAINTILTHTWTNIPVNTLVSLTVGIESLSTVIKNFNDGGFGESAFHNTVTFANPNAVFGLAEGVTANSGQLGLSDNSLGSVTIFEPGVVGLFDLSLALLAIARRRASV
jgi:hypothetical protein